MTPLQDSKFARTTCTRMDGAQRGTQLYRREHRHCRAEDHAAFQSLIDKGILVEVTGQQRGRI